MCLRRLLLPSCLLFWAAGAGAADLIYGDFLLVRGISRSNARLQMPLSRKKYADVRLLDRSLYRFLLSCGEKCSFQPSGKEYSISSVRAAKTRPDMWIAQVEVNNQLALTFLIFKEGETFRFVSPSDVIFKDKSFLTAIEASLKAQVQAPL